MGLHSKLQIGLTYKTFIVEEEVSSFSTIKIIYFIIVFTEKKLISLSYSFSKTIF